MKTGGRIDTELFYHLFYVTKERKRNMYQAANDRYEKMAYVRCGKSGLKLPAISLGLWHNFGDTGVYENMKEILSQHLIMESYTSIWQIITDRLTEVRRRILARF